MDGPIPATSRRMNGTGLLQTGSPSRACSSKSKPDPSVPQHSVVPSVLISHGAGYTSALGREDRGRSQPTCGIMSSAANMRYRRSAFSAPAFHASPHVACPRGTMNWIVTPAVVLERSDGLLEERSRGRGWSG